MTKQYQALLGYDDVELEFEADALAAIADKAIDMEIGARGLRSVMEKIMTDVMFSVPSDPTIERVVITAACVAGEESPRVTHREHS
jgi:ATP-dependent Clp protease ATP-binding subunit ClpX